MLIVFWAVRDIRNTCECVVHKKLLVTVTPFKLDTVYPSFDYLAQDNDPPGFLPLTNIATILAWIFNLLLKFREVAKSRLQEIVK